MDREDEANLILAGGISVSLLLAIGILIVLVSWVNVEILLITLFAAIAIPIFISEGYRYHYRGLLSASIAKELGLELVPSPSILPGKDAVGTYQGYPLRFSMPQSSFYRGTYFQNYRLHVESPSLDYGTSIQPRTLISRLITGRENEVVLGDPEFDKAFLVTSADPGKTRRILSPALRHRMLDFRDGSFEIGTKWLTHTLRDKMKDMPYWKKAADFLIDIADSL